MTGRDKFVISFTRSEIESRIRDFFDLNISDIELQERYKISDYRAFRIAEVRRALKFEQSSVVKASYRPFDHRWTYFPRPIIQEWQNSVHAHMFGRENRAMCVGRAGNVVGGMWDICFCTKMVTDLNQIYRGGNVSLPIYRFPKEGDLLDETIPNFTRDFTVPLGQTLGLPLGKSELPKGLTPDHIFHYAYAVFHSPGYRSRYAEFLKIDFPRLPLTGNLELFRALARLGGELVALHLMESAKLDNFITAYTGPKNPEVERVGWSDDTVWLDAAATKKGQPATPGTVGFRGVPAEVWNFHIGGYQVCHKWLKDRKARKLLKADIEHYKKILVALAETIRSMKEIDEVIEKHGGWPGAFRVANVDAVPAVPEVEGNVDDFGWIVPFPTEPTIVEEDPWLFTEIQEYVNTRSRRPGKPVNELPPWPVHVHSTAYPTEVRGQGHVGDFDFKTTTILANETEELNKWLEESEYRPLAKNAEEILAFYREKGYVFACINVSDARLRKGIPVDFRTFRFSFKTGGRDGIYFPMKMSGLQEKPFEVNLYVFYKAWLNDHVSKFGHDNRGFLMRYRDWDTPTCTANAGKNYSDPEHDSFLAAHTNGLVTFSELCQRLHPGAPYYLTHLHSGTLDPQAVRSWSDDLWLFPNYVDPAFVPHDVRPSGPASLAWPNESAPKDGIIPRLVEKHPWLGKVPGIVIAIFGLMIVILTGRGLFARQMANRPRLSTVFDYGRFFLAGAILILAGVILWRW